MVGALRAVQESWGHQKEELLQNFYQKRDNLKVTLKEDLTSVSKVVCSYVSWTEPAQRHLQIQE